MFKFYFYFFAIMNYSVHVAAQATREQLKVIFEVN